MKNKTNKEQELEYFNRLERLSTIAVEAVYKFLGKSINASELKACIDSMLQPRVINLLEHKYIYKDLVDLKDTSYVEMDPSEDL